MPRPRSLLRRLAIVLASLLVLAGLGVGWLYLRLRSSLPHLDGRVAVAGLTAPVTVERDALGVPLVSGSERTDVARALGYVHGQDRFFQMDLMRRQAAGELSELIGPAPLPLDRRNRLHRFRWRAERAVASLPPRHRALLDAYVEGVNAGLSSLGAPPFEYLLLRSEPAAWTAADTVLVVFAMYFELNDESGRRESARGVLRDVGGPALSAFLDPLGTAWDAPIVGPSLGDPPIPGPELIDLRGGGTSPSPDAAALEAAAPVAGSNNWAVSGAHTAHGGALLANDMHLGHSVPNIWYRAALEFPDTAAPEGTRRMVGVTLPGAPFIVAGSNGQVAWGFTNTWGDWEDLVILEPAPGDADAYLTADGPRPFEHHAEVLHVKGGDDETLDVVETVWGPVLDTDHLGRRRALAWIAHRPRGINLALADLEQATNLDQALLVANRAGAPPQNFVAVDAAGHIGWTVMGPIPRRYGHDGRFPCSWADGSAGWDGWLEPDQVPRVVDPPSGRLWTANSRVVEGAAADLIGRGTYRLGARARQIRDDLLELEQATERDLLGVQLDDRALFLARWRDLLLETLDETAVAGHPRRQELRRLVDDWGGRAAPPSAGYRLVRAWRSFVAKRALEPLTAAVKAADSRFDLSLLNQLEGPLWRLASERPGHLLAPGVASWNALLLAAADDTLDYFADLGPQLSDRTWGERNTVLVRHPLSRAVPWLGRWLDMPPVALPGDSDMPRFQAPTEGASERMVVGPGHEESGIFHMPAGQSGNPLSPFYRAGHEAWVRGEATPFLPGSARHTLELVPAAH